MKEWDAMGEWMCAVVRTCSSKDATLGATADSKWPWEKFMLLANSLHECGCWTDCAFVLLRCSWGEELWILGSLEALEVFSSAACGVRAGSDICDGGAGRESGCDEK
jgi:hypothetical protein